MVVSDLHHRAMNVRNAWNCFFTCLHLQYVQCSFRSTSPYAAPTSVSYSMLTGDHCRGSPIIWFNCVYVPLGFCLRFVLMQRSYYARRVYIGRHYPLPLIGTPTRFSVSWKEYHHSGHHCKFIIADSLKHF